MKMSAINSDRYNYLLSYYDIVIAIIYLHNVFDKTCSMQKNYLCVGLVLGGNKPDWTGKI